MSEVYNEIRKQLLSDLNYWDVKKDDEVLFFDRELAYELTGYRPINDISGLDFDPEWFCETRNNFLKTGHYSPFLPGSKRYQDFWRDEYKKCKYGLTVNGYTITGEHYFFLNFYQLMDLKSAKKAAGGRLMSFPKFVVPQYEFFHYFEMCKRLRKNVLLMKARGVGFSEMNASIMACMYSVIRNSSTMVTALKEAYVSKTLEKAWAALSFLNDNTDGGMFKLRQVIDSAFLKRSSKYEMLNGLKIEKGFMSQIVGITADTANKIRGDRVDLLIFEEAGSNSQFKKSFIQGLALVEINGERFGLEMAGGTGGDSGPLLAGLKDAYYQPDAYDILPFRHRDTIDGELVLSGFFIPANRFVIQLLDERGWTDPVKGKEYYESQRDKRAKDANALLIYSAEYCLNAEEAFSLEGNNTFNKVKIAEQLALIRLHKTAPKTERGFIDYFFKGDKKDFKNITGYKWIPNLNGSIEILEHPIWSDIYKQLALKLNEENNENNQIYDEMHDMYVAGIDGIDIGMNDTSASTKDPSLFCMVIMRRAFGLKEPQIVCIYKDRPDNIREAYKTSMCLARYYNCRINIEATRVGMITWARENDCLQYFMKRPRATLSDVRYGNTKQYGTPATPLIISLQNELIGDFVEDYAHTIWHEELLDLLQSYSVENKTKFDIIAALAMTLLADLDLSGRAPIKILQTSSSFLDIGYYKDERGIMRYGVIPKKKEFEINTNTKEYDPYRYETSDPRLLEIANRYGVYRGT